MMCIWLVLQTPLRRRDLLRRVRVQITRRQNLNRRKSVSFFFPEVFSSSETKQAACAGTGYS